MKRRGVTITIIDDPYPPHVAARMRGASRTAPRLTIDEATHRPACTDAMPPGSTARRHLDTYYERREAILSALVEYCGGTEAARERVAVVPAQPWEMDVPPMGLFDFALSELADHTSATHVLLDGAVAWIGGLDRRAVWREKLQPGCPEAVAHALPPPRW